MTRETQTTIIVFALILFAALGFWMFQQSQDALAIARGDYVACWTDHCKSAVAGAAANRLGGADSETLTTPEMMTTPTPMPPEESTPKR